MRKAIPLVLAAFLLSCAPKQVTVARMTPRDFYIMDRMGYMGADGQPHTAGIFYDTHWGQSFEIKFNVDGNWVQDEKGQSFLNVLGADSCKYLVYAQSGADAIHGEPFLWSLWDLAWPPKLYRDGQQLISIVNDKGALVDVSIEIHGQVKFIIKQAAPASRRCA